jgi:hypothetical protein
MHQEFLDFRAMGLIRGSGKIELHRADDSSAQASEENSTASRKNSG